MGCTVESSEAGLTVQGGDLTGDRVDMAAMPDLVPTLAVVAAFAKGRDDDHRAAHLRHRGSDRLAAVATELTENRRRRPGDRGRGGHSGGRPTAR